ncbi:DUF4054 domain-containing protein [Lacrimispora sp.]|uniref:DUF4054 domain-containing protein n=1 Tax=Lacrimispora sp. TaxID=2719234 RepID=UPI0029E26E22|nr:hypothetical protein [Lacrimispora sp.]
MSEQFNGLISAAANMPQQGELGTYTSDMFLVDFPQFKQSAQEDQVISLVPDPMLQVFINNANASILPSRYCEIWRYAAGLYVAHFSALYLKTYSDGSATPSRAAATGQQTGLVKEATMGDTTISYDNEAITEASAKWGAWNATQYGQQLVTMARMIGMGGMYVI